MDARGAVCCRGLDWSRHVSTTLSVRSSEAVLDPESGKGPLLCGAVLNAVTVSPLSDSKCAHTKRAVPASVPRKPQGTVRRNRGAPPSSSRPAPPTPIMITSALTQEGPPSQCRASVVPLPAPEAPCPSPHLSRLPPIRLTGRRRRDASRARRSWL